MKRRIAVWVMILCLVPLGAWAEEENEHFSQGGADMMEYLWKLDNPDDFVIALMEHLEQKTQYGRDLSVLTPAERAVYITQTLEMEVNNGGFSQFFYNSSGDYANELVSAFHAIGANATANICLRAVSVFGRDIPVDRFEREEMMDELLSDEIAAILDECDKSLYAYEDDLAELTYRYVLENKDQFN